MRALELVEPAGEAGAALAAPDQPAVVSWPLLLTVFLPFVAFGMLIPAIGEEPGWRGFAWRHVWLPLAGGLLAALVLLVVVPALFLGGSLPVALLLVPDLGVVVAVTGTLALVWSALGAVIALRLCTARPWRRLAGWRLHHEYKLARG